MTRKTILCLLTLLVFVQQLPPVGTPAGTRIFNGGDFGLQGDTDTDGDVILYYSTELSDTVYTTSEITEIVVSSGFAIAPLRKIASPLYVSIGEKNNILYEVCNLANTTDSFVIELTSSLPAGWNVYLVKDDNQNKLRDFNENNIFTEVEIAPDTTYYFFIVVDISSIVSYGTSVDLTLVVKNQAGVGTDDGWYDDDTQISTFTVVAILPTVRSNIPVPVGLKIFKTSDGLTLSWDLIEYKDLAGFLIYKANSIENLCKLLSTEFYASTNSKSFVDKFEPNNKVWYKIKSVDKYFNLSEDSMFISSEGEIVCPYYENKISAILYTSQDNEVLYRELNNIGHHLHIKLVKGNIENNSTDISVFSIECFKDGVLSSKIDNIIILNSDKTKLGIYYDVSILKEKTGTEDLHRISMFYHNQVEWINIGGGPLDNNLFVNHINHNGKYKLAIIPKIKQFEIVAISPKKFYSPLEPPPLDKVRFVLKHRKTIKPIGKIFDLTGAEVKTMSPVILNEGVEFTTTEFVWDGKDNHGKPLRSGIYIYQFESNDGVINGSIILVK